eukprot:1325391-Rhodomonas_salina.2
MDTLVPRRQTWAEAASTAGLRGRRWARAAGTGACADTFSSVRKRHGSTLGGGRDRAREGEIPRREGDLDLEEPPGRRWAGRDSRYLVRRLTPSLSGHICNGPQGRGCICQGRA